MPNWCQNKLTVTGPAADIAAFVDKAHGPVHKWVPSEAEREWLKCEGRDPDESPRVEIFSFHQLVPIPAEVLARPYHDTSVKDSGYVQGFDHEINLWGIKWGAHGSTLVEQSPGRAVYTFTTPWGPGEQFFATLAEHWPNLTFRLSFSEEYPSRGRLAFRDGEQVLGLHEQDCPVRYPSDANPEQEEAWERQVREWRDHYLATHDAWEQP